MINYRRERIRMIRDMIYNLTLCLTLPVFRLEKIPFKFLQNTENNIQEWLVLANKSDKYISQTYISENEHDDTQKTDQENCFNEKCEK